MRQEPISVLFAKNLDSLSRKKACPDTCMETKFMSKELPESEKSIPVYDPDDPDILMRNALHRGFREPAREICGTTFTSWEQPLPNLTWSRQRIENVKRWIDQGGFDWEVAAALKRKAKTGSLEEED